MSKISLVFSSGTAILLYWFSWITVLFLYGTTQTPCLVSSKIRLLFSTIYRYMYLAVVIRLIDSVLFLYDPTQTPCLVWRLKIDFKIFSSIYSYLNVMIRLINSVLFLYDPTQTSCLMRSKIILKSFICSYLNIKNAYKRTVVS